MSRILYIVLSAMAVAMPAEAQLNAYKREDLSKPLVLGPGQAAIVVGFRRSDKTSMGKSAAATFARYDPATQNLILQPRDAKKQGDTTTYSVYVKSGDRNLPLDHAALLVSPGDYVLSGAMPGPDKMVTNSFCLRAPTFRVNAGEIVYFGDFTPYLFAKMKTGRSNAMAYSSHLDDVRNAFLRQPLASAVRPAEIRNGASYQCFGQMMMAYDVPSAPMMDTKKPTTKPGS